MSKLTRALQQIFASGVAPSGQIETFGSTAAGSPVYSNDPVAIQTAKYLLGWSAAQVGNSSPVKQDRNALDFLFSRQLAYLFQEGIAEWDPGTVYYGGFATDGAGNIFASKQPNNLNHVLTDTNWWTPLRTLLNIPTISTAGLLQAWAVFDGTPGVPTVFQSLNVPAVGGVVKNSVGNYTVNFSVPFGLSTPGLVGNCQGLVRPIAPSAGAFQFDTAFLSGGAFSPHDFSYVSVAFYGG